MDKINCVFCATPDIASDALQSLYDNPNVNLSLVVSMPDRPAGRGKELRSPEIINKAKSLEVPTLQTENLNNSEEFHRFTEENSIDIIIVFAFAQFLNSKTLSIPKLGCFNIHTSLLPKYRGAAPMQYSLFNGDKETGVSIQKMVKKMDAGNIVAVKKIEIEDTDNLGSLHDKMKESAPLVLDSFISDILNNNLSETVQDEKEVSFSPSIPKKDTLLEFEDFSSEQLHNKIRGLSPIPCAYCFANNKRLKVFESEISSTPVEPGKVSTEFNTLLVGTKEGTIRLKSIQLEGKPRRSDFEFINGLKSNNTTINIHSHKS